MSNFKEMSNAYCMCGQKIVVGPPLQALVQWLMMQALASFQGTDVSGCNSSNGKNTYGKYT